MTEDRNKVSFLNNMLLFFNIGWVMVGSIFVGFLFGRWISRIFKAEWLTILFALVGAGGGMLTVWRYYSKKI